MKKMSLKRIRPNYIIYEQMDPGVLRSWDEDNVHLSDFIITSKQRGNEWTWIVFYYNYITNKFCSV